MSCGTVQGLRNIVSPQVTSTSQHCQHQVRDSHDTGEIYQQAWEFRVIG